jgi:putative ABC transport system substrate-binding protein
MNRRGAIAGLLAIAAPRALAQAPPRPKIVAVFVLGAPSEEGLSRARQEWAERFARQGLRDGEHIRIEMLTAPGLSGDEAVIALARGAVSIGAAVIIAHMAPSFVQRLVTPITRDIGVVVMTADDHSPDTLEELQRRGADVTGVMYMYFDLVIKRFEIARQLLPSARRAAGVVFGPRPPNEAEWQRAERWFSEQASRLGMEFEFIFVDARATADSVLETLRRRPVQVAEVTNNTPWPSASWQSLARAGIATCVVGADRVKAGALVGGRSWGWFEASARLAARILRGARASSIPVERTREYQTAINLRTARTLGVQVPPSILLRMDEVFE